jgi:hypothetical protein
MFEVIAFLNLRLKSENVLEVSLFIDILVLGISLLVLRLISKVLRGPLNGDT